MTNGILPVRFQSTGVLQLYIVPTTGSYMIAAAGAQGGGHRTAPGGKGALARGVFHLRAGEVLHLVVGKQGEPGMSLPTAAGGPEAASFIPPNETTAVLRGGGGGGGTFIWKSTAHGERPTWPLLAAGGGGGGGSFAGGEGVITLDATPTGARGGRNGGGGPSDTESFYYTGGGGAGWLSVGATGAGPTYCSGGTHWEGGNGACFGGYQGGHGGYGGGGGGSFFGAGSGGGGGYSGGAGGGGRKGIASGGGSSYNAGREQMNVAGFQPGDGFVTIVAVPTTSLLPTKAIKPTATIADDRPIARPKAVEFTESLTLKFLHQQRWHYPSH